MTKKAGRPKIGKQNQKSVLIGARFTPDESKQVHDTIKKSGEEKSAWIRKRLLSASA